MNPFSLSRGKFVAWTESKLTLVGKTQNTTITIGSRFNSFQKAVWKMKKMLGWSANRAAMDPLYHKKEVLSRG